MTIPTTLSDSYRRLIAGEAPHLPMARFLDAFYTAKSDDERRDMLVEEPPLTGDTREDAFAGAVAEYLAKNYRLGPPPAWTNRPERYLNEPWHTTPFDSPGMIEYLTWASPAEFRSRNIFTEERPLRRARMPR
jgi:hypothetical protein